MEPSIRNKKIDLLFGVIIFFISLIMWVLFYFTSSIIVLVPAIFSLLLVISILTRPIKENIIVRIFDFVFGGILGFIWLSGTIFVSFSLIFLSVMITWGLITTLFKGIIWLAVFFGLDLNGKMFETSILYISSLITAVSLSYYGEKIISLFDKLLRIGVTNSTDTSKNLAISIYKLIDFRKRVYESSIFLYIFSVFERLSQTDLITIDIWINYKSVALEVLITFVAIDTYVRYYIKVSSSKK